MRIQKRKIILPVMVLLLGMTALGAVLYGVGNIQQNNSRKMANLNAMVYSERVKSDIMQEVGVTKALKQLLVSENGRINKFSEVAEDMMMDSVQSIQLAPDGVVTEVYPEEGNEAGKIDLFNDAGRGEISRYARDNHIEIMQGPFQLEQGGYGMAVRNPIYLKNENGEEEFWGFTIVIIRVPDVFFDSLKALSDFDYDYTLSKTVSPWDTTYEEVCSSGAILTDPVAYEFEAVGSRWKLEIMPKAGWSNYEHFYGMLAGGLLIVLLLTGLVSMILALDEHKNRFKKLAVTDVLTRINNRHGFEEQVRQYLKKYPEASCVAAQFDIDDFKFINDMYGHEFGDKALQILAESMRKSFPEHAVLGRKDGDEFCIFLDNCTGEEVREKLEQFTKKKRSFWYEGEKVTYTISLGYAEYPLQGQNYSRLMRCADAALYEVKLDGKNGCLQYREGIGLEIRKQLGFALKDVSENLPGAFIIYKADKENDEILFANHEMIRLTGCRNMAELQEYTKGSFRNLIEEGEREQVEESIWQQIGGGHSNDYVHFHLRKADGTSLRVLDHGRIVENGRYGRVFYVLMVDWNSTKRHYRDVF